jgi:PilZ domain-containing protein
MVNSHFAEKRADPRYSFFADAEVILSDGTSVPTQLAELSASGCYIGTLLPISTGTRFRIRIWDSVRTCELQGKVMYLHSSSGLGIFGMGVLLEEIAPEERRMIDRWLYDLDGSRPQAFYSSPQQRLRHPRFT